jgi:hypothetical protein
MLLMPRCHLAGFAKCFPVFASLIVRPQLTLLGATVAAIVLSLQSPVLALAPFCLWTAFMALYIERRLIDRLLFPPFTVVACWAALGTGVGIPIMDWQIGNAERMTPYGIDNWHPALATIQVVWLASFPVAWLGYYYGGFRKVAPMPGIPIFNSIPVSLQTKVVALGWVLFLISVITPIIKVIAGLEKMRGMTVDIHAFSVLQVTLYFLFSIAPKWGMLGFAFVPLLWKRVLVWHRIVILVLVCGYFVIALVTGSRGNLMFPCCFIVAGAYFFRTSGTWKTEATLSVLGVLGIAIVFALYVYRNSQEYRKSSADDILTRYRVFRDTVLRPNPSKWRPETFFDFGYSFYSLEDVKVYALTPNPVPHVGFSGFEAIPFTCIPTTIARNKPRLLDAEFVVGSYDTPPTQVIGTSISLAADGYRRFGWAGIPAVVLIGFGMYGALTRWMLTWWRRGTLWGWALLFFSMSFFWSRPFSTVLETWWSFFYDMPKQLLATAALCFVVSKAVDLVSSRKGTLPSGNESISTRR